MVKISKDIQEAAPTFIKGSLVGIAALAILGQFWPGYMLDSSAKAEREQAVEMANVVSASLLCGEYYKAGPDSADHLAKLRSTTSYVGENKEVDAAVDRTLKAFKAANISHVPSEYRVKSDCVEALRKKPAASAQLQ